MCFLAGADALDDEFDVAGEFVAEGVLECLSCVLPYMGHVLEGLAELLGVLVETDAELEAAAGYGAAKVPGTLPAAWGDRAAALISVYCHVYFVHYGRRAELVSVNRRVLVADFGVRLFRSEFID